jgi:hypothetical protein
MTDEITIDFTNRAIVHGPELNALASSLIDDHFVDITDPSPNDEEQKSLICETKFVSTDHHILIETKWNIDHYNKFGEIKFLLNLDSIAEYGIDERVIIHPTYLFAFLECVRVHFGYDHLLQVHEGVTDYIYGVHKAKNSGNEGSSETRPES